ncbi:uncharacterized protein MKK02DRAFT_32060 [Dioszegia hungarica]|uniref:Uncharacterized protein n=1 Tax=Dioszegia hungarica TaxID=4972 RepID=A0AA38LY83_9TREE|nr:uncharacterized protein MKK02DRAFT_32060 [Dioszegia hungarica]KAI9638669.1 hypothetical protein MKK02DRAFT_32060 [Dioszegia hungarica]
MPEYTDAKGVVYDLQIEPDSDGIQAGVEREKAGPDGSEYSVQRHAQQQLVRSPRNPPPRAPEISPKRPHPAGFYVYHFTRALYPRRSSISYMGISNIERIIDILLQYDCVGPAQRLLFDGSKDLDAEELYDAFVLASRLDDTRSACRILPQGFRRRGIVPLPRQPTSPLISRRCCAAPAGLGLGFDAGDGDVSEGDAVERLGKFAGAGMLEDDSGGVYGESGQMNDRPSGERRADCIIANVYIGYGQDPPG